MDISASQFCPPGTAALIDKMKTLPSHIPNDVSVIQEALRDTLTFSKLIYSAKRNQPQKIAYIKLISDCTDNMGPQSTFNYIPVNAEQLHWTEGACSNVQESRIWLREGIE